MGWLLTLAFLNPNELDNTTKLPWNKRNRRNSLEPRRSHIELSVILISFHLPEIGRVAQISNETYFVFFVRGH